MRRYQGIIKRIYSPPNNKVTKETSYQILYCYIIKRLILSTTPEVTIDKVKQIVQHWNLAGPILQNTKALPESL